MGKQLVGRYAKTGKFASVKKTKDRDGVWIAKTSGGEDEIIKVTPKSARVIKKNVSKHKDALERLVNR